MRATPTYSVSLVSPTYLTRLLSEFRPDPINQKEIALFGLVGIEDNRRLSIVNKYINFGAELA